MTSQRTAQAGWWSMVETVARHGLQFIASLVFARLLTPADFGLIVLVSFFSSLINFLLQHNVQISLVQRQNDDIYQESTLFWLNILASTAMSVVLVLAAPALSTFFEQPILTSLFYASAGQLIISALGAIQTAILMRDLKFRMLAVAGVLSAGLGAIVGIVAALLGAGVWSFAIQTTVGVAVNSGMLWILCSWRPKLVMRIERVVSMLRFGAWASITAVLDVLYTNGSSLFIGKLHGMQTLGLYSRAAATQALPNTILSTIIVRVALPIFASNGHNPDIVRTVLRRAVSIVMLVNAPVMVALIVVPDLCIAVLFGEQWTSAAPILSVLAICGLLWPISQINLHFLMASGDSRKMFVIEVEKKLLAFFTLFIGSFFGLLGLAWSQVAAALIAVIMNAAPTQKSLDYGLWPQLRDLRGIGLAAACMGSAVALLSQLIETSPLAELAILGPVALAVYLACGFGLKIEGFNEGFQIVRVLVKAWRPQEA